MSVVPRVQHPLFWIVINLCGVGVVVGERHSGNHLSIGVCIEGIFQFGVLLIIAVHSIQDAAHDEAISITVPLEPGPPGGLRLRAEVCRVQSAQNDHLLHESLLIQGRVDNPQAALIHGEGDAGLAAPLPG